jgi:hypothetical protein
MADNITAPLSSQMSSISLQRELPYMFKLAEALLQTGFLPDTLKLPGQVVAIILAGRELGIPPMTALRTLHIVDGKISFSAQLQLALANRAGIRHRFLEISTTRCEVELTSPDEEPARYEFTIDNAKKAGLLDRSVSPWHKYPKNMLQWRCVSNAISAHCPEVMLAVYDPDEVIDIEQAKEPRKTPATDNVVEAEIEPIAEVVATELEAPAETETLMESEDEKDAVWAEADSVLSKMATATPPLKGRKFMFAFGPKKGVPLSLGTLEELAEYGESIRRSLNDPAKEKWRKLNEETLMAVREEYARKRGKKAA